MITIKEQIYNDIMQGKTGNGLADMIPGILEQKMAEGYTVYLTDESGRITTRVVCSKR
jgi:hypothetical protein